MAHLPPRLRLLRRALLSRVRSIQVIQAVTQSDAEAAAAGLAAIREGSMRARQRAATADVGTVQGGSMEGAPGGWVEQMMSDNSAKPDAELGL